MQRPRCSKERRVLFRSLTCCPRLPAPAASFYIVRGSATTAATRIGPRRTCLLNAGRLKESADRANNIGADRDFITQYLLLSISYAHYPFGNPGWATRLLQTSRCFYAWRRH